jgi:hypothetical protein
MMDSKSKDSAEWRSAVRLGARFAGNLASKPRIMRQANSPDCLIFLLWAGFGGNRILACAQTVALANGARPRMAVPRESGM